MTTPNKLLATLAESRSTTAALACAARVPFLVAHAMIQRLEKEGLVESITHPILDLWELTDSGRAAVAALTKPASI